MSYTYEQRKRPQGPQSPALKQSAEPGLEALMNGQVRPTAAQKGRQIDLDGAIKAKMEHAFGDLSAVKLYESRAVGDAGAEAIARGNEIAFAPGMANFSSRSGQERLGHELSHVMSQRSGQVRGQGFLASSALEARADREGALAAAGEQVYTGPVTHALSDASPSPAVAGPMQARRSDAPQEDEQVAQINQALLADGNLLAEPRGHQLDIRSMEGGKRAYRKDENYQTILDLMRQYNSIDEAENAQAKDQAEIALSKAAMDYIEKASGGKTAKHKGRTAKLEQMLYQLNMRGGVKFRANENLGALRTASRQSEASQKLKNGAEETFRHLKGIYNDPNSAYSPTMQMITAGVLADQNVGGATAPIYSPQDVRSAASPIFAPGSPGFSGAHNYTIVSRTGGSQNDAIGTTLHELTHVASGEVYQNAALMNIKADATDEEIRQKALDRVQTSGGILDALGTSKVTNLNEQDRSFKNFATDKLSYQVENKLPQYEINDRSSNLKSFLGRSLESRGKGDQKDNFVPYANNDSMKYLLGQRAKPTSYTGDVGGTMEEIKNTLTEGERTDLTRIQDMSNKQRHVVDLLSAEQQDPQKRNEDAKKKKTISKFLNANKKIKGEAPQNTYSDFELAGSNALVEHDSVMNQLLLQYENADQKNKTQDRDSLFYRRLRNAALRAHLERREHKLKKRNGLA